MTQENDVPHLQFIAKSVLLAQIVTVLRRGMRPRTGGQTVLEIEFSILTTGTGSTGTVLVLFLLIIY